MGVKTVYAIGVWKMGIGIKDCRKYYTTNPSLIDLMQHCSDGETPFYEDLTRRLNMEFVYKETLKGIPIS